MEREVQVMPSNFLEVGQQKFFDFCAIDPISPELSPRLLLVNVHHHKRPTFFQDLSDISQEAVFLVDKVEAVNTNS